MSALDEPLVARDDRLRWWEGSGSPGVGGYVLAVVVSALAVGPVVVVSMVPEVLRGREDAGSLLSGLVVVTVVSLVCAGPVAVPGVLLVHLLCLRVRDQGVHVLAAGLAGAATVLVWEAAVGPGGLDRFPLVLGIATACGRAAVVPLARRRRARRWPVDDDSRDGAARC